VLLGSAVWFYVRTAAYLVNPSDGDLYAHNWNFQVMVFAVFHLPVLVLLLGVVLGVEYRIVIWRTKRSVATGVTGVKQ
jgi:hypothetical protein